MMRSKRSTALSVSRPVSPCASCWSAQRRRPASQLSFSLSERLLAFTVHEENGQTLLSGDIADQDALYDLLGQLRAAGLPLIAAQRAEPDLEEVFVRLTGDTAPPATAAAEEEQR